MNWSALGTLALYAASIHWIMARANVTRWFWALDWWPWPRSLVSGALRGFAYNLLACAACSGFWIGLGLGLAGILPLGPGLWGVLGAGGAGVVVTPVVEGLLLWGLAATKAD